MEKRFVAMVFARKHRKLFDQKLDRLRQKQKTEIDKSRDNLFTLSNKLTKTI